MKQAIPERINLPGMSTTHQHWHLEGNKNRDPYAADVSKILEYNT
jgi:hypothetical protein